MSIGNKSTDTATDVGAITKINESPKDASQKAKARERTRPKGTKPVLGDAKGGPVPDLIAINSEKKQ